jgi:eukaryotic-like serine/threonine-protein kinase
MTAFESGKTLGRYRIVRLLGQGAMGEVYLAEDPQIQRQLAIKTLRLLDVRPDEIEERRERLLREARTAGRLLHPNIVTLFDAAEEDGWLYLAFEYVDGSDLAARLVKGPPLTLGEALRMMREASVGLDFAHRHGIVHRDIKPHNMLLDGEGRLKISDFGIAKLAGQTTELTVTGSVMGSPHYLSPEQIRGVPLDGRSDLFSLGVVIYELLGGRRPFEGDTIGTLVYQILHTEPPPVEELRPDVPPRLRAVVRRLLAKEPEDRFATAGEVASEIAAAEAELGSAALSVPAAGLDAVTTRPLTPPATGTRAGTGAAAGATSGGTGGAVGGAPLAPSATGAPLPPPLPEAPTVVVPSPSAAGAAQPSSRRGLLIGLAAAALVLVIAVGVAGLLILRSQPRPIQRLVQWLRPSSGQTAEPATPEENAAKTPAENGAPAEQPPATSGPPSAPTQAGPAEARPARPGSTAAEREPTPTPSRPTAPAPTGPTGSTVHAAPSPPANEESHAHSAPTVPVTPAAHAPAPPPPAAEPSRPEPPIEATLASGLTISFRVLPADAFVLLDGTVIGQASDYNALGGRPYTLPGPGSYVVTLRRNGMKDRSVRLEASAGGPAVTPLVARMVPIPASDLSLSDLDRHQVREAIAFRVEPRDARVLVDGVLRGPAARFGGGLGRGGWLELPPGMHRVTLVAPGRRRVDLAVEVTSGASEKRQKIEMTLPPAGPGEADGE